MVFNKILVGAAAVSAIAFISWTDAAPTSPLPELVAQVSDIRMAMLGDMYDSTAASEQPLSCPAPSRVPTNSLVERDGSDDALVNSLPRPSGYAACNASTESIIISEIDQLKATDIAKAKATLKNLDSLVDNQLAQFKKNSIVMTDQQTLDFKALAKPFLKDHLSILSDDSIDKTARTQRMLDFVHRTDIVPKFRELAATFKKPDNLVKRDIADTISDAVVSGMYAIAAALLFPFAIPGILLLTVPGLVWAAFHLTASIVFWPIATLLCFKQAESENRPNDDCFKPYWMRWQ